MRQYNIMLIDDSSTNNLLYESILEDEGYNIVVFENAIAALTYLQTELPDLILLDIMMPGMDGFSFLENLPVIKGASQIPIIMLTANTNKESHEKALRYGVSAYLTKPTGIKEIVMAVHNILNQHIIK